MLFQQDDETLAKQIEEATKHIDALAPRIEQLQAVRALFDQFQAWERFRDAYLVGVRLRQLREAAAAALCDDEARRTRIRGQLDEVNILCMARDELDTRIQAVVHDRAETEKRRETAKRKLERKTKR